MAVVKTQNMGANSAFAAKVNAAARSQATRMLNDVAREAVVRVDKIIEHEFNNGRAENRRRPGPKLLGSFSATAEVVGSSRILATITLTSSAEDVKVNSLNSGANPHTIAPVAKPFLAYPLSGALVSGRGRKLYRTGFARRKTAQDGPYVRIYGPVQHPGVEGTEFMERALEQAINHVLHKAVHVKRK